MDARRAIDLMREHLNEWDLRDWACDLNTRLTRVLGRCRHDMQLIELSERFVLVNEEPAVLETILHEIAHAKAGVGAGHGQLWKLWARRVGATPKACASLGDYQLFEPWRSVCPGCRREFGRARRPKRTMVCVACKKGRGDGKGLELQWRRVS